MKILFLLAFLVFATFAGAQTPEKMSTLTGLVYDDHGAVIVNAIIKIRGNDNIEKIFKTNDTGIYEIQLRSGNYSVQVEANGFQTFKVDKFRVVSSYRGKQNLDIAMEVGPCAQCHRIEAPLDQGQKPK